MDVAGQDSWFAEVSFGTDTIVRHGNVWSGGNEGERWQIVRTTLFFSFFEGETRLCNIFLFCGGKPGNFVILGRGCCQRDSDTSCVVDVGYCAVCACVNDDEV